MHATNPKILAGLASTSQKMNPNNNDMPLGSMLSQKTGIDLMQNCDLPPPLKVFSGLDKTVVSSMNKMFVMMEQEDAKEDMFIGDNEKLELLKALRLSQTRAREAERRAATLAKERDWMCSALMLEAWKLSAHRQWVRLLDAEVLKLQSQLQQRPDGNEEVCVCGRSKELHRFRTHAVDEDDDGVTWILAFAICLGIGMGLAFGCRCLF